MLSCISIEFLPVGKEFVTSREKNSLSALLAGWFCALEAIPRNSVR